eukprot:3771863-Alexandrium_andersonii.AAC.1
MGSTAQVPREPMASPPCPMGLLRRSPWPPPGQGALHVQHFPAAREAGQNRRCGGPAARVRVLCSAGSLQWP